jgi:predicted RNase H-like HicB family nuclease
MLIAWSEEDKKFVAISPQLRGLRIKGETRLQAAAELEIAIEARVRMHRDSGSPLAEPLDVRVLEEAFRRILGVGP